MRACQTLASILGSEGLGERNSREGGRQEVNSKKGDDGLKERQKAQERETHRKVEEPTVVR